MPPDLWLNVQILSIRESFNGRRPTMLTPGAAVDATRSGNEPAWERKKKKGTSRAAEALNANW